MNFSFITARGRVLYELNETKICYVYSEKGRIFFTFIGFEEIQTTHIRRTVPSIYIEDLVEKHEMIKKITEKH